MRHSLASLVVREGPVLADYPPCRPHQ